MSGRQLPDIDGICRVYGLEQRRIAYLDRLNAQLLQQSQMIMQMKQEHDERIRISTFSRVEECIEWVRVRLVRMIIGNRKQIYYRKNYRIWNLSKI